MPRKPVILSTQHPYHITVRSNNRDWFDLPLNYCYGIFSNVLHKTKKVYGFKLHAFVLMDNHFHMIISTPEGNISQGMRYFMTESSRGIRVKAIRTNHVFGGRYRPSLITSSIYYAYCLKYVYRNPVVAGLADRVEEYPWSTVSKEKRAISFMLDPIQAGFDEFIQMDRESLVGWLNEPPPAELDTQISKATRRSVFEIKPNRNTRGPVRLVPPK